MEGKYSGAERLVVKVGTGFIFDEDNGLYKMREDQICALVGEVKEISNGREVVIVSSGAIATGASINGLKEIPKDTYKRAQLAGEGQPYLMREYQDRFRAHKTRCAQCLICGDDINNRKRRRNLRKNQEGYFSDGVIAVYNENDFIATNEITFGDNDILAALLAKCIDADLMVMLSNPTEGLGTGGGDSKKAAREMLEKDGIAMEIINSRYEMAESGVFKPKIRELL